MAERCPDKTEVEGSIPSSPTFLKQLFHKVTEGKLPRSDLGNFVVAKVGQKCIINSKFKQVKSSLKRGFIWQGKKEKELIQWENL